jgi:hypothetical protein
MSYDKPSFLDWTRATVGIGARIGCWACVWFIVANAAYQAIEDDRVPLAIFEVVLFPITFFVYPFAAEGTYSAWPFAEGTTLIPALVAAVLLYPISTLVGGLGTMEDDMRGRY